MTPKQWRDKGYKTIFRTLAVYLYHPQERRAVCTNIHLGHWQRHNDPTKPPWSYVHLDAGLGLEFALCAAMCYCDQGVDTCDYCAGRRPLPSVSLPPPR